MTPAGPNYRLAVSLARRPGFCGCCWCLSPEDSRRTRRVLRLVNAVSRDWRAEAESLQSPIEGGVVQ